MSRIRTMICLSVLLLCLAGLTGCVNKDETLESEVKAGAASRDKARVMQTETDKRTRAGEAVLDGK